MVSVFPVAQVKAVSTLSLVVCEAVPLVAVGAADRSWRGGGGLLPLTGAFFFFNVQVPSGCCPIGLYFGTKKRHPRTVVRACDAPLGVFTEKAYIGYATNDVSQHTAVCVGWVLQNNGSLPLPIPPPLAAAAASLAVASPGVAAATSSSIFQGRNGSWSPRLRAYHARPGLFCLSPLLEPPPPESSPPHHSTSLTVGKARARPGHFTGDSDAVTVASNKCLSSWPQ